MGGVKDEGMGGSKKSQSFIFGMKLAESAAGGGKPNRQNLVRLSKKLKLSILVLLVCGCQNHPQLIASTGAGGEYVQGSALT